MSASDWFDLLRGTDPVVAPLALDPLTAKIAQKAGFKLVYVSGGALGYAHGVSEALLTVHDVSEVTARIALHSEVGVIVDIGVGFGDPVHVFHTVRAIAQAGGVAVELEDQVAPKRVSHHRGIEHLVDTDLMVAKIAQAHSARAGTGVKIIARTGAVKNESFAAALDRLHAYADAGADVLMLMPQNAEQIQAARQAFDKPLATIAAMDQVHSARWRDSGWNLIIDPFTAQVLAVKAIRAAYEGYQRDGKTGADLNALFDEYHGLDLLAGLGPLYDIEDETTERSDP